MTKDPFPTPPQPEDRVEACPDGLMEAVRSIHKKVSRLDRAVMGDPYALPPIPGLRDRVAATEAKLDAHIEECHLIAKQSRKRWSLPKKIIVAAMLTGSGAFGAWCVVEALSRLSSQPSTARARP